MDEVEQLTRELVSIASHVDESMVGDRIEAWIRRETDGKVRRDPIGNVIATRGNGDVSLGLIGHHDVVPPDDNQVDGDRYLVIQRDGRLYGRGTADMKGAVAAALLAFRDAEPNLQLVFASFVGEEQGGTGVQFALEHEFDLDFAVVGEGSTGYSAPGVTDVAIAHRGRRGSRMIATGRSAHASEPEQGENAIYTACDAIDAIRSKIAPRVNVFGHEVTGSVTVTQIDGGDTMNVIADRCEFTIDERTVPGERAPLDQWVDSADIDWEIDQDLPPMRCFDNEFASAVLDIASEIQVAEPEFIVKPHATDAGWLAANGTACVVCGPAEPGQAHTDSESVDPDVLNRCYRIYTEIAEQFHPE